MTETITATPNPEGFVKGMPVWTKQRMRHHPKNIEEGARGIVTEVYCNPTTGKLESVTVDFEMPEYRPICLDPPILTKYEPGTGKVCGQFDGETWETLLNLTARSREVLADTKLNQEEREKQFIDIVHQQLRIVEKAVR